MAHHCPRCRERCDSGHICPVELVSDDSSAIVRRAKDVLSSLSRCYTIVHDATSTPQTVTYIRSGGLSGEVEALEARVAPRNIEEWFISNRAYISPPIVDSESLYSDDEEEQGCPVCRNPVAKDGGVVEVYGAKLDGNCSICLDRKVTHIFTGCGHAVVCGECAKHWL